MLVAVMWMKKNRAFILLEVMMALAILMMVLNLLTFTVANTLKINRKIDRLMHKLTISELIVKEIIYNSNTQILEVIRNDFNGRDTVFINSNSITEEELFPLNLRDLILRSSMNTDGDIIVSIKEDTQNSLELYSINIKVLKGNGGEYSYVIKKRRE